MIWVEQVLGAFWLMRFEVLSMAALIGTFFRQFISLRIYFGQAHSDSHGIHPLCWIPAYTVSPILERLRFVLICFVCWLGSRLVAV
jgi:hypothetical protein